MAADGRGAGAGRGAEGGVRAAPGAAAGAGAGREVPGAESRGEDPPRLRR